MKIAMIEIAASEAETDHVLQQLKELCDRLRDQETTIVMNVMTAERHR